MGGGFLKSTENMLNKKTQFLLNEIICTSQ